MTELLKAKSEFRKKGVTLIADKTKSGGGGTWSFAGEDNFIKTIQAPLTECGLEYFATMSYSKELGVQTIKAVLFHVSSGESIDSTIALTDIEPKLDRNGNKMYLDAEIERGKQFGYWSRILGIRLLGLSDIDPESMHNAQEDLVAKDEAKDIISEIKSFINELDEDKKDATTKWILKTGKVDSVDNLTKENATIILNAIKKKKNEAG